MELRVKLLVRDTRDGHIKTITVNYYYYYYHTHAPRFSLLMVYLIVKIGNSKFQENWKCKISAIKVIDFNQRYKFFNKFGFIYR